MALQRFDGECLLKTSNHWKVLVQRVFGAPPWHRLGFEFPLAAVILLFSLLTSLLPYSTEITQGTNWGKN